MEDKQDKRYFELQMKELKEAHADKQEENTTVAKKDNKTFNAKNIEIAKMYEDAAEYEEDLKGFEEELEIVKTTALEEIAAALDKAFPEEERDYANELDVLVQAGWTQYVEVDKTHPQEQLELIKTCKFGEIVEKLKEAYPEHEGDFEEEVRAPLIKRWEGLVAIKKEHIAQELADIKTTGLKPKYVKRIYQQYHGLI